MWGGIDKHSTVLSAAPGEQRKKKKKKLGKDSQLKTKMEVSVNQKNKVSGE